jgi:DNA-binding NarL/FixJ family response regulator
VEGTISVFLLAENRLLREALARILRNKSDIRVVGSAAYSPQVIEEIVAAAPRVLLYDFLPHAFSDLGLIAEVHKSVTGLRIVLIGMDADKEIFLQAVRQGVAGYLLKDASAMEIAAAVRSVANCEAVCAPSLCLTLFEFVARQQVRLPSFTVKQNLGLSRREQQLVEMIGRGLTNKEIAGQLNLSEQTVKNHVHHMLRKVGATDRLAVVEVCRTQGLVV